MKLQKPKKLKSGDLIGVISPASSPEDLSRIEKGVRYLEKIGYKVKVGKNVATDWGYLAGTDEQRLEDLHDMFSDKEVSAIFCVRGGYGSGRLLDRIDYSLIKRNPKIFLGYSDITSLQMAFLKKCGLVTFAGPMVAVDFYDKINSFAEENLWDILTNPKKIGKISNPENESFYVLTKGRGEGQLMGGNLSTLVALLGSQYLKNFKDSILLLEEIGESPYKVDRMFNQLKINDVFKDTNGVVLGRFVDCYEEDQLKKTLSLNEVIADYFSKLEIPVFYNIKHGHIPDNLTMPYGINCKLNTSYGFIEFTESAVI